MSIDNSIGAAVDRLGLGARESQKSGPNNELGQDQFMDLMIAQIQNQDPFQPMENGDFIAQMAQFSTSSGMKDLQKSFDEFASSMTSNQALQASTLVGRTVSVPSEVGALPAEGSLNGKIFLPVSTTDLTLHVYDSDGELVKTFSMGTHEAGEIAFSWDGEDENGNRLEAGKYKLKAEALVDGQREQLWTTVQASVESVSLNANRSPTLHLEDLGSVSLSDVHKIM